MRTGVSAGHLMHVGVEVITPASGSKCPGFQVAVPLSQHVISLVKEITHIHIHICSGHLSLLRLLDRK